MLWCKKGNESDKAENLYALSKKDDDEVHFESEEFSNMVTDFYDIGVLLPLSKYAEYTGAEVDEEEVEAMEAMKELFGEF